MKKPAAKPLILSAYPRGDHLDLFTASEERKEVHTRRWERLAPPVTATRKTMAGQIGNDAGKFQTTLLCVDSSRCLLQILHLPTVDPREADAMAATGISLFPVLNQAEFAHSRQILHQAGQKTELLAVAFRKDELMPLLEKIDRWGVDFPVIVPDMWAVWKHLALKQPEKFPDQYVWVWMDPATDEKKMVLKILIIQHGRPWFVFQPFIALDKEDKEANLAEPVMESLHFAFECAARQRGEAISDEAPVYFSSYQLKLDEIISRIDLQKHPKHRLELQEKPHECAASVWQIDRSQLKNWLPDFWKDCQTQRSKKRTRMKTFKGAGIAYGILLILFFVFTLWQKNAIAKENQAMESQRASYEKAAALKKQVSRMRAQAEGSQNALDVLYLATLAMPKELTLTGYNFKFQEGLSLRGFASSNDKVYDYVEALKKTKPFHAVSLGSVRNNPQKNWVEFDIQCKLNAQQESPAGAAGALASLVSAVKQAPNP
jgi:hypothetical protein